MRTSAWDDLLTAKYYPEDQDFLLEFEPKVQHFVVAAASSRRTFWRHGSFCAELFAGRVAVRSPVEVIDLPKVGIKGNSHMVMMDKNSSEVAAYIQAWLERQGLYR